MNNTEKIGNNFKFNNQQRYQTPRENCLKTASDNKDVRQVKKN